MYTKLQFDGCIAIHYEYVRELFVKSSIFRIRMENCSIHVTVLLGHGSCTYFKVTACANKEKITSLHAK